MNSEFFDRLNEWIRNTESSIVNFLSSFAPWLAPIIPAYMTYSHATGVLDFPIAVAVPAAMVVEILGFSAVSTFLAFWFYNRRTVAGSKRAPIEVVIIAFVFYLALIVLSNVLLDASKGENWETWAIVGVRALYTLQTIPAALIVAVRTQHRELLADMAKEKREKQNNTEQGSSQRNSPEILPSSPQKQRTSRRSSPKKVGNSEKVSLVFSELDRAYNATSEVLSFSELASILREKYPEKNFSSNGYISTVRNNWIVSKEIDSESK